MEVKPKLLLVTGENFLNKTGDTWAQAGLDIRSMRFGVRGLQAFFDIRIFDPNAKSYFNTALRQCYTWNEKEKNGQYKKRVLQIEHGSFILLVFSIYWVMSHACNTSYDVLSLW